MTPLPSRETGLLLRVESVGKWQALLGEDPSQETRIAACVLEHTLHVELSRRRYDAVLHELDTREAFKPVPCERASEHPVIDVRVLEQRHLIDAAALEVQVDDVRGEGEEIGFRPCGIRKVEWLKADAEIACSYVAEYTPAHRDGIEKRLFVCFADEQEAVCGRDLRQRLQRRHRLPVFLRREDRRGRVADEDLYGFGTEDCSGPEDALRVREHLGGGVAPEVQHRVISDDGQLEADRIGCHPKGANLGFRLARNVVLPDLGRAEAGSGNGLEQLVEPEVSTLLRRPPVWFEGNCVQEEAGQGLVRLGDQQ
jgi:hypothetical protein